MAEIEIQLCPDKPCEFCYGDSAVVKERDESGKPDYMTSWEWCQQFRVCAASIDWEKVMSYGDRY